MGEGTTALEQAIGPENVQKFERYAQRMRSHRESFDDDRIDDRLEFEEGVNKLREEIIKQVCPGDTGECQKYILFHILNYSSPTGGGHQNVFGIDKVDFDGELSIEKWINENCPEIEK